LTVHYVDSSFSHSDYQITFSTVNQPTPPLTLEICIGRSFDSNGPKTHARNKAEWGGGEEKATTQNPVPVSVKHRVIHLLQVLVTELGVSAGCLWTGVSKQVLDGCKVARFLEHLGTKPVAETVGGQVRGVTE